MQEQKQCFCIEGQNRSQLGSCFLLCKMAEDTQPETVTHDLAKSFS